MARDEDCKLLGHFRSFGEPPALRLGQVVELNDTRFFIAVFTGLKPASGLRFSFNPCRRWEYINYSGGNDHLFTVYYVVNEQVREIAESVAFRLVAASGCSTYPLVFNKVTFSKKRLSKSSHGRAQDSNAKKPKRSDSIETVNETTSADKNHQGSPFDADCFLSRSLYSFHDKDDAFATGCRCMEWINDNEGV